ncbi:hypothetical protein [Corticibacter populi]|uniref:hypothetical protein n=1 Tax=Corticibacter populi TaxID=1550736 RepID=UPI0013C2D84D|nr:hypothetical protein [Corticibacter populi]
MRHAPTLAQQANARLQGPAVNRTDQRLGQAIAQSAKGDCAKGEYQGSGMGLLSAPFLVAAAVNGDCAR